MTRMSIASLPRSPRRHLTHRPGTPRGAILRLSALAATLARLDAEGRDPDAWQVRPTDTDVADVLDHLGFIRSRSALAASYAREGRRLLDGAHEPMREADTTDVLDALDLAYALRWLQLGEPTFS
jgi:hypothetical protein